MSTIETRTAEFKDIADNPGRQLKACKTQGKKAIGVGPYYCPEELVYAAGMVPFGVWGSSGNLTLAQQYFPPFYCSLAQRTLEMGLQGQLDDLDGMMMTTLCDTLKPLTQNWQLGVPQVPAIVVSQPQNRKTEAGLDYAKSSYGEVKAQIEDIAGKKISDEDLNQAIAVYNDWRAAMRAFIAALGTHPGALAPSERSSVIKASYFMDKKQHSEKVKELTALIGESSADMLPGGMKVVISGIHADMPGLLDVFDELGFGIVADDVAHESRAWAYDVPTDGDPLEALAKRFCAIDNCSVLYDVEKNRAKHLIKIARDAGAEGVIIVQAKFCDPEEFDVPIIREALSGAGIPSTVIEVDQQMEAFEQARTALQAFTELSR